MNLCKLPQDQYNVEVFMQAVKQDYWKIDIHEGIKKNWIFFLTIMQHATHLSSWFCKKNALLKKKMSFCWVYVVEQRINPRIEIFSWILGTKKLADEGAAFYKNSGYMVYNKNIVVKLDTQY